MSISLRSGARWSRALLPALAVLVLLGGCRLGPRTRRLSDDTRVTPESLESSARVTSYKRDRASKYLDASVAYLRDGRAADALRCAQAANQRKLPGPARALLERTLGEAHLRVGQVSLARRYLGRAISKTNLVERDRLLALLVVACNADDDLSGARKYRDMIQDLSDPGVTAALAVRPIPETQHVARRTPTRRSASARRTRPAPTDRSSSTRRSTPGRLPSLTILPRDAWSANSIVTSKVRPMRNVRRVTVHHSGPPKEFHGRTRAAAAEEIRKIQRHHQKQNGWGDIGYHYVIDRRGEIWQGRPVQFQGAHASGKNDGNIGIVVLGNYDNGGQHLEQEQANSLTVLVAHLSDIYGVRPDSVYTHREITGPSHTRCPGPEITAFVSRIRTALEQRLVAMRQRAPAASVSRVAYQSH